MRQLYFDHSATTLPDNAVIAGMMPYFEENFGIPASIHSLGRKGKAAVESAREEVAALIGALPQEIVFTSGGTESVNLALLGAASGLGAKKRIITSQIEHPAVLRSCAYLSQIGFNIVYLPVNKKGQINPQDLADAITADTGLISIMQVNHETGVLQPVKQMAKLAKDNGILFHTDAVAAVGKININVSELGIDLLSLSGHKIYAPKGVGALYIKSGIKINPLLHGGHEEHNLRAGTENVAAIVGLGTACGIYSAKITQETEYIRLLADNLWGKLDKRIDGVRLNGHPEQKLPGILSLTFSGVSGESLLINLDLEGIIVSAGSVCSTGSLETSHVLLAMGLPEKEARCTIRISLGRNNTVKDIETLADAVTDIVGRLK